MAKGKKTGGRKAGTPNKVSVTVKDNVITVFEGIGGAGTMKAWAQENLTEFYKLYAKLIPTQIDLDATVLRCDVTAQAMTAEEWTAQYVADGAAAAVN